MRGRPASMFVAFAVIAAGCQAPPAELSSEDMTTLRGMFDTTLEAFSSGDLGPWVAMWSDDAVLHPPHAPRVEGREAIAAFGESFPEVEKMTFSDIQVWGSGDLAWGTSGFVFELAGLPVDTGKQLVVFRRSEAGGWEVVAASFNSDLPMPTP